VWTCSLHLSMAAFHSDGALSRGFRTRLRVSDLLLQQVTQGTVCLSYSLFSLPKSPILSRTAPSLLPPSQPGPPQSSTRGGFARFLTGLSGRQGSWYWLRRGKSSLGAETEAWLGEAFWACSCRLHQRY